MSPLLLARTLYSFFPSSSPYSQPLPPLRRLSLSDHPQPHQSNDEEIPFIAQYLVSSFGFSLDRALKVSTSRNLTAVKSHDRPDSVVTFLQEIGLSDSEIRSLISFYPALLMLSVDKTLKPRVCALIDAGFDGEMLIQLVRWNPQCLYLRKTLSRLQFWRNFVGNNNGDALLKFIQHNALLISFDIDKHIIPRINLLKEFGLSDQKITRLITKSRRFFFRSLDSMNWALNQTEELGILRESNMYLCGLQSISGLTKETLEKKLAFFIEIYGWSEEEVYSAFRKFPTVLALSEENIRSKMDYLIKHGGFEPRSIASQAILLGCSLENKLVPRNNVLSALETKGLIKKGNLLNACVLSEKRFLERFVVPYEKDVPEIGEAYSRNFSSFRN